MPARELERLLENCPLFRGFSVAEKQEVLGLAETRSYSQGEVILNEGQSFQFLWLVLKGRCQVVKSLKDGGDHELSILEPCSVFGEMSFFSPAPHSASVRALTEVEVGRLPRERYDMLLRIGSIAAYKLAFNMVGVLADRLRTMDDWACTRADLPNGADHREEWREFQSKLYSGWQF